MCMFQCVLCLYVLIRQLCFTNSEFLILVAPQIALIALSKSWHRLRDDRCLSCALCRGRQKSFVDEFGWSFVLFCWLPAMTCRVKPALMLILVKYKNSNQRWVVWNNPIEGCIVWGIWAKPSEITPSDKSPWLSIDCNLGQTQESEISEKVLCRLGPKKWNNIVL